MQVLSELKSRCCFREILASVLLSVPLLGLFAGATMGWLSLSGQQSQAELDLSSLNLPPATGRHTPLIKPEKGPDGLYHHTWFRQSFLDLKEEWDEAKAAGKKLVVFVEQRGCSYCEKIQKEILALNYINTYVRDHFHVVQLNLWGERKVTDFDGTILPEKDAARRWGVLFTPTIIFYADEIGKRAGMPASAWEVARMPGAFKKNTFYDMFVWIATGAYKTIPNFQAFHINRINARKAQTQTMTKAQAMGKTGH